MEIYKIHVFSDLSSQQLHIFVEDAYVLMEFVKLDGGIMKRVTVFIKLIYIYI